MVTRALCTLIAAGMLLGAWPSSARARKRARLSFKVRKTMDLKHVWKKPTFASQRYGELMDRGQLLYLGRGLWFEQGTYHFLRTKDLRRIKVQAPVQKYLLANRGLFPRAGQGRKLPEYTVERLLFYDSTHQVAGIHLTDRWSYKTGGRHFYLHWDLKRGRITHAVLLDRKLASHHWVSIKPIGYDPTARRLYLSMVRKRRLAAGSARPFDISVLSVGPGTLQVLYAFTNARRFSRDPFFDVQHRRALLVEYAERGQRPSPRAHLVHFGKKRRLSFAIPVVTYGVAFSADGKRLYAYSAQSGKVWDIDAQTGKLGRARRVGGLGHAAGMVHPGLLLVVRNKGFHFLETSRRLRERRFVPLKRFHKGFMHTQGTLVAPGRVYLRTSDRLRVIDVSLR